MKKVGTKTYVWLKIKPIKNIPKKKIYVYGEYVILNALPHL
jgi:hypothetical protein